MVHVLLRHKVADYSRWKETFDAHLNTRMRAGELGCRLFQGVDDPREVTLLLDWDSVEHARKFMTSAELQSAMEKAGVIGSPDVHYIEDARMVRRTAAD